MKQPIQPIDHSSGHARFRPNAIVKHLLSITEKHGYGLNKIADLDVSNDDREQFAQLIGYSLRGFGELSYVSEDTYQTACRLADGETEDQARIRSLEESVENMRAAIRDAAVAAFRIHPDDLTA